MELLELIQLADSAPQVMALLGSYVDSLREMTVLPEWWLQLPLDSPEQARQSMLALMGVVHAASRQLDHRRCAAAKQALHVFAAAVWKLRPRGAKAARGGADDLAG
jgi:hypothetical protein